MFNVTVLKMKDIIKYLVGILITIIIVMTTTRYFSSQSEENQKEKFKPLEKIVSLFSKIPEKILTSNLSSELPIIKYFEQNNEIKQENLKNEKSIYEKILQSEISTMGSIQENAILANKNDEEQIANTEENENTEIKDNEKVEETSNTNNQDKIEEPGTKTEVVTNNPITESFNVQYGAVKIKNQTSYTLTEEIMNPDITIDNKNIILFHTHSCESYTASEKYQYTPTGNYRTTDLQYTVTNVGTELQKQLQQYGYSVTHDTSYHDYPSYNGSYTNSLKTVQNILTTYQADIIMDVHRDAIGSRPDYAPTVKIGENDYAAQIMFVIGTNAGGLYHPNWNQNLKFAIKIQQKAEEMYPGLFKPIMLTESRYNQHTGKYASIIEVGATGNTMEQCLTSMKYLARIMKEVLQ